MTDTLEIPLGGGAEFDRVREIARALGDAAGPLGDDTASIPAGDGTLVVSTDVSVEGVHFRRVWMEPEEIGWRATAAALSDLAAAAAVPAGVVIALTIPADAGSQDAVRVMRGVGGACRACGARVLGGDLSSGAAWSLAVTVFGHATRPMSRRGARPGDGVWVTGSVGGAHGALQDWIAGRTPDAAIRERFVRPMPRIAAARWLAEHGATAMIDVSDGVAGDAQHVAAASAVRLEIDVEALPLAAGVHAVAARHDADPVLYGASGGEDYEIMCTLPAAFDGAAACTAATGVPLTRIGTVCGGVGAVMRRGGLPVDVGSFRHEV